MESQSLPELCLYSFTNKKCETTVPSPFEGHQIIKQRTKSSSTRRQYSSKLPRSAQYLHQSLSSAKRRLRSSQPASAKFCNKPIARVCTPGYTLSRSYSAVEMKINVNQFFQGKKEPTVQDKEISRNDRGYQKSEVMALLHKLTQESLEKEESLQREIVELNIKYEDQKTSYQELLKHSKEEEEKIKKRMLKSFAVKQQSQQNLHEKELLLVYERHQEELREQESKSKAEKAQLQEEIEFHKRLMEDSKKEMRTEAEERLSALEDAMRTTHQEEIKTMKTEMEREKEKDMTELREDLTRMYKRKISAITQGYEAQVTELKNRNLAVDHLADKLMLATQEINKLKENVHTLEKQTELLTQEKRKTETKLFNTISELQELKDHFQDKVKYIEKRFLKQIDNLRLENTQLRGHIMKQTEQISNYHAYLSQINIQSKANRREKLMTALQARASANLSLIQASNEVRVPLVNAGRNRPTSAPGTTSEAHRVQVMALAKEKQQLRSRPYTTKQERKSFI